MTKPDNVSGFTEELEELEEPVEQLPPANLITVEVVEETFSKYREN